MRYVEICGVGKPVKFNWEPKMKMLVVLSETVCNAHVLKEN